MVLQAHMTRDCDIMDFSLQPLTEGNEDLKVRI